MPLVCVARPAGETPSGVGVQGRALVIRSAVDKNTRTPGDCQDGQIAQERVVGRQAPPTTT